MERDQGPGTSILYEVIGQTMRVYRHVVAVWVVVNLQCVILLALVIKGSYFNSHFNSNMSVV